jgi:flagellar basal-body rod protein FlgF
MQPTALKLAGISLRYLERKQAVTANNLANVSTTGFKAERVFANLLENQGITPRAQTDMRAGSLTATGNPLDVALEGNAMFVVATPEGHRYTRGGSLQVDANGRLVDASGNAMMGDNGEIVLPPGRAEINNDGSVLVNGDAIDRLRIERMDATGLTHEAAGLFRSEGAGVAVPNGERLVRAGHLESSNVTTLDALVDMIEVQRAYSAMQSSIRSIDDVMRTASNEIGRV